VTVPLLTLSGAAEIRLTRAQACFALELLRTMGPEERHRALLGLPRAAIVAIAEEWWWQAHGGQCEPEACEDGCPWRVWSIVAGRGFGKTRAGAEWVWQRARENPDARIALVGASLDEVARVMVEGESGLLSIPRAGEDPRWLSSRGEFRFPSGARAFAYTAERPSQLRGPQHHFAWCDELAKWPRADPCWDNLMLGLRLGDAPRTIVTTTPKPVPLLKRVLAMPRTVQTNGATAENPHLPDDFRAAVTEMFGGTLQGRQELDGLLLDHLPGALWTRSIIEEARAPAPCMASFEHPALTVGQSGPVILRVVVGVDPPASADGDACGIVVCGLGEDGIAYVLADLTAGGMRPEAWARRVVSAAEAWNAQRIVAEKNQGGDMVESVLKAAGPHAPVRLVHAAKGKGARAQPIALRFESGQAKFAGLFPDLEDELCAITYSGFEGTASPDRADALVWALTELATPRPEPGIRRL